MTIKQKNIASLVATIAVIGIVWLQSFVSINDIDNSYKETLKSANSTSYLKSILINGLLFNSSSAVQFINSDEKSKKTMN
jgi:hypothetical protein